MNVNNTISRTDQIKIVENIVAIAHRAIYKKDAATLLELSKLAEGLEKSAGDIHFHFFTIGEYLYDSAMAIKENKPIDEWTLDQGRHIADDLKRARTS